MDLGGVLLNIDYQKTIRALEQCSQMSVRNLYAQDFQDPLFDNFECGHCNSEVFIEGLAEKLRYKGPRENLVEAWNAMLLDMPEERLELLVELNASYRVFLLSNTNALHRSAFDAMLYLQNGVKRLSDYFETLYYSHEIGLRKPNPEVFKYVLQKSELLPEETLFVDDSLTHCKAAGSIGISAHWLSPHQDLIALAHSLQL